MKNSWGQDIKVGDVVYRGARQGNSSEYKAGVVESLKTGKSPRIKWLFESYTMWVRIDGELVSVPYAYKMKKPSMGSPSLGSLIVVDFDIEELERVADFFRNLNRDIEFMSLQEFEHARDSHQI